MAPLKNAELVNHHKQIIVFFIEFPKVWPIICAISEIFCMFHAPTTIFQS
jgi:hypothetical protein